MARIEINSMPRMKVWVVLKSAVDLPHTVEFIGAFTERALADNAVLGAGTYTIAEMDTDRRYSGDLLQVYIKHKLDHRQL
jgi:hypothetical protein